MSTQAPPDEVTRSETVTTRGGYYWERCRRGALPLVVGALGLAGLGVGQLLPVRNEVEQDLRIRSLEALSGAGLSGVDVDFTGQDGVLTGTVSSAADAERALGIVRGLRGVRVATSQLAFPGAPGGSGSGSPTASPAATTTPDPSASVSVSVSASASVAPSVAATPPAPSVTPSPATPSPAPSPAKTGSVATVQQQLRALPPVAFAYDSSQLTPAGRATVARAAAVLKAAPNLKVRVEGFTDSVGDWDVNLAISRSRAAAVRAALIENGIAPARITSVGFSEARPKVPNTSAANRAINRRVEFVVS